MPLPLFPELPFPLVFPSVGSVVSPEAPSSLALLPLPLPLFPELPLPLPLFPELPFPLPVVVSLVVVIIVVVVVVIPSSLTVTAVVVESLLFPEFPFPLLPFPFPLLLFPLPLFPTTRPLASCKQRLELVAQESDSSVLVSLGLTLTVEALSSSLLLDMVPAVSVSIAASVLSVEGVCRLNAVSVDSSCVSPSLLGLAFEAFWFALFGRLGTLSSLSCSSAASSFVSESVLLPLSAVSS